MSTVPNTGHRLDEAFAQQVALRPTAVAVQDEGREITFAALDRLASRIAAVLASEGCDPGTLVGVRMGRGWRTIAAILAIWQHGCGYVPIDPGYPQARQDFVISDAGLTVILTEGPDEDEPVRLVRGADTAKEVPEGTAYVIYTSGSTGTPKGVIIGHSTALAFLEAAAGKLFELGPEDVCTWFHSISFDFSFWEMWGALLSGSRVLVVPAEATTQPRDVIDLIRSAGVTVLCQTPTFFGHLVRALEDTPVELPALRQVLLGGEPLDTASILQWADLDIAPRCVLHNLYGLTETTVCVTAKLLDPEELAMPVGGPSIGLALPHTTLELVENGQVVPPGTPGELWAAGDCLALGYLDRPQLTQERFVTRELGGRPAMRWYRTGDYALRRENGEFEFLGRRDDQVKLRGYRIELGEIENALASCAGVDQGAVVVAPSRAGDPQLVACYVADEPGTDLEPVLRGALGELLPPHMVPARFLSLPRLPQNFAGKLDRQALIRLASSARV